MNVGVLTTASGKRDLTAALNAFCRWNKYLFLTRALPPLYESGIRYVREDEPADPHPNFPKIERWQMADVLSVTKRGDCEDLCLYRVGWLRAKLGDQAAFFRLTNRGNMWHVTVRRADGVIEDPSARLGMR